MLCLCAGKNFLTKVNANFGNSAVSSSIEEEVRYWLTDSLNKPVCNCSVLSSCCQDFVCCMRVCLGNPAGREASVEYHLGR